MKTHRAWLVSLATLVAALIGMLAGAPAQALAQALSISDATVAAEGTGTTPATAATASFTITLSAPAAGVVTVSYATANGTATAPADYAARALTPVTFAPGETAKQVVVTVNGDALDEADETFLVQLSSAANATIADDVGVATIVDDDPQPTLSVNDQSVSEGGASGASLVFTVTLSAASGRQVTVDYATADGSAALPFDYTPSTGTLTFVPGDTTETVSVPILSDTVDEVDETLVLDLTLPAGSPAAIADPQGIGTIVDDDGPTISIGDATVDPEGATGTTKPATFTISLSAASVQPVTVKYATANATATATTTPADYTAVILTTVTFAPGETAKQVTVTVLGDALDEIDETFLVALSAATNATIPDPSGTGTGVGTIVDDDDPPALSVSDPTVVEGTGITRSIVFDIALSAVSGRAVTVDYATADGTAVSTGSPTDFTAKTSGTTPLSFPPGVKTLQVSVQLVTDSIDEVDETLFFDLTLPAGSAATIAKARGIGTIDDDDGPAISIHDVNVPEGDAGSSAATFTVSLSAASPQPVTMRYSTATSTTSVNGVVAPAASAPADYTAVSSTLLTFAPGETSKQVAVTIHGDAFDELDEVFEVRLGSLTDAAGSGNDTTGVATIVDDDAPPAIRVDDVSVSEGSVGSRSVDVAVSLDRASDRAVSVSFATGDVTAKGGVDYGERREALSFGARATKGTIAIPIGTDAAVENDETFTLTLSDPVNASIERGVATVTIVDDDLAPGTTPSLSVADVPARDEGDSGTKPVTITVRLSNPAGRTVSVSYATADDSAVAPADYAAVGGQLEFAPGETTRTIETTIQGDEVVESNHAFKLNLSAPVNATIDDGSATVTIDDDDIGLGAIAVPASVNASKVFCSRRKGCAGLAVRWTVLTRGTLVFELTALAPRKTKANPNGVRVIPVLKTSSTITRARTGTRVLRPTPGARTRRLLRRLRSLKAGQLRLKVTFTNRSGESESRTERVKLDLRR